MILTIKQQLKHLTKSEYNALRELCRFSKNLVNQALYEVRQEFFNTRQYLNFYKVYDVLKTSDNYRMIQANMAQQILKRVDSSFRSFFGSIKSKNVDHKVHIPRYLPKDGYGELIIQMVNITDGKLQIPYSRSFAKFHEKIYINVPPVVLDKHVKMIKIVPKYNARFFEIVYSYETEDTEKHELDKQKALAIDLGIDNFCTCASSDGEAFIIDGRKLKSFNQWFNKENARLCSIKDRQKYGKFPTARQVKLAVKRANRIRNYLGKTAKHIIRYCLEHNISNLVLGKNKDFQMKSDLGKKQNQVFVNIPYGQLSSMLRYQCERYGINFVEQEESYTSKASFWDKDDIPVYGDGEGHSFSGKRIYRGMYLSKEGKLVNADVNGALNILRKSNVVDLEVLYSRGELSTPVRIRVA